MIRKGEGLVGDATIQPVLYCPQAKKAIIDDLIKPCRQCNVLQPFQELKVRRKLSKDIPSLILHIAKALALTGGHLAVWQAKKTALIFIL